MVFKVDPAGNQTLFTGEADGGIPMAGVIRDAAGNLYGATTGGGSGVGVNGCGVVYELNASGQEMVLHTFTGALLDGCGPWAGLAADAAGNLYGTAPYDGPGDGGVLYKITF